MKRQQRPDASRFSPVARRAVVESPNLFHVTIEIKPGALNGYLVLANSRSQAIDHVYGTDHATILSCVAVKRVSACAWTLSRAMYEKEEYAAIERTLVAMQDERATRIRVRGNEPIGWPRNPISNPRGVKANPRNPRS